MNNKACRIGFVIALILILAGLAASVILSIQLNTTRNTLAITEDQLSTTQGMLAATTDELASTEDQLSTTQGMLAATQSELQSTQTQLAQEQRELELYKDTWGSVVASDVLPPYQGADIVNQSYATNPTWAQLLDFILNDKTDQKAYVISVYMCGDYAREVHNNAELLGIRAAYVIIEFPDGLHACNAFKITDSGLVFIDCTGPITFGPSNRDKIVSVKLGNHYIPISLFPESGWSVVWNDMGVILDVQVYW